MREIRVVQGTAAWLQERVGRITASRMCDVMAKPKRGRTEELACRRDYRTELLCERLTLSAAEHHVSRDMDWGTDQEPFARSAYEVMADSMVDEAGLVLHPNMDFTAASPDGLVGTDGAIEIKAPKTSTHLEWRMADEVPEPHRDQMMWVMACCERDWCEFISFDPRLPQGLRFFVKRLYRDEKRIAEMEFEAIHFNEEVEQMRLKLSPGHVWVPSVPQLASETVPQLGSGDFIGDLMAAMDGADSTEGSIVP